MRIAAAGSRRSSRRATHPHCWCRDALPLGSALRQHASWHARSALRRRRCPAVHRRLQHPPPTVDPPVPSSPIFFHGYRPRLLIGRVHKRIQSRKHVVQSERGILALVYGYCDFQIPPYMASQQLSIARIAAPRASFSSLPCQA
jgi:hypothetical protein